MSLEFLREMADRAKQAETGVGCGQPKVIGERTYNYSLAYEPGFSQIAFEILKSGKSMCAVGAALGVGLKSLDNYRAKFPDFDIACDAGIAASIAKWEALGEEHIENPKFRDKIWLKLLESKWATKDPARVILNIDSASDASHVASIVDAIEKSLI